MALAEDETLKNVISNLKKDLECPVCLEVVKNPFKLCERGHLMCVVCLNQQITCRPTCKGDLLQENPVCIKNILEHLPHNCKHSTNGCSQIIEDGNSHEKFCGFRRIKCKICSKDMLVNELLEHAKKDHLEICVIDETDKNERIWENFIPSKDRTASNLVYALDNLFWITFCNSHEKKQLSITFEVIPTGKLEDDYYLTAKFTNGNFDFRSTIKAAFLEETGQSYLQEASCVDFRMTIPQTMLPHFVDKNGHLVISEPFFFKG